MTPKEIDVTCNIFKGKYYEHNHGSKLYWMESIYSESWQCWTIQLYHLVDNVYKPFAKIEQREFAREIQRMQEVKQ